MESNQIPDSPLMTPTQREVLALQNLEHDTEDDEDRERQWRAISSLRDRLRNITADYVNLLGAVEPDEIRTVFQDLSSHTEYKAREKERIQESIEERGTDISHPETGEVMGRVGRLTKIPDADFSAEEGELLREGIISALAFYYLGVDDREEFALLLEQAIGRANRADDTIPKTVDVTIDMEVLEVANENSRDALIQGVLADELDSDEAAEVLDAEPGVLIEMLLSKMGDDEP